MRKKTISIMFAAALAMSVFTGCSGSTDDSSSIIVPSNSPEISESGSLDAEDMMPDISSIPSNDSIPSDGNTSDNGTGIKPTHFDGWATTLVNAKNPLPEGFSVDTRNIKGYDSREFNILAADSLEAMLDVEE